MNSQEKQKLRETTFQEQIQTLLTVERNLAGRWVIQRFQFDDWLGVRVNPLMTDDPIHEEPPISGTATFATSGEAVEAMIALHEKFPDVQMRVSPVENDIRATGLSPRKYDEKSKYGEYPTWGELLQKFPELADKLVEHGNELCRWPFSSSIART